MVNEEDLDEMYDMYVDIQPVEGNFNNKGKLSEEDYETPSKKRKTLIHFYFTFNFWLI